MSELTDIRNLEHQIRQLNEEIDIISKGLVNIVNAMETNAELTASILEILYYMKDRLRG